MSHPPFDEHPFDEPEPDESFLSNAQSAYAATTTRRADPLGRIPEDSMLMSPYRLRLEQMGLDFPESLPRLDELIDKAILTSSFGAMRAWIKQACSLKRPPVLELILHRMADIATPVELTPDLLHTCARNDFFEGARILIQHGADPLGRSERGQTPLMAAIETQSQRCALYLSSLGGLDLQDAQGHAPLHFACASRGGSRILD